MLQLLPRKAHTYTVIGHLWMRAVLQGAAASCTVVVQEIVAPLKLVKFWWVDCKSGIPAKFWRASVLMCRIHDPDKERNIVLCTGQPPTLQAQQGRSLLSMGPPALTSESIALGGSAASASMYLQSTHVRRPYNPYYTLYSVQSKLPYNPNVHLLQQVGLFQRGFLLITLPCSTSTYHTLALPQMWTWVAFKRIFDCLRKEGCEAYDIGTGNSCADPFLWRGCKTLPNRTWRPILVNIGPWLTRYLLSWDHFTRIFYLIPATYLCVKSNNVIFEEPYVQELKRLYQDKFYYKM